MKYTNLIYFRSLNSIGGIETLYYNVSCLFKDLDITFICVNADYNQKKRLSKNIRVIEWNGKDRFECERLILNFNLDIIDYVDADEYVCFLQGDYYDMLKRNQLLKSNLPIHKKINKYYGVSQLVIDSWKKATGLDAELCYNILLPPKDNKVIRLCSAQRLSNEKGGERIKDLAMALDKYSDVTGDKYIWDIYSDGHIDNFYSKNLCIKKPRLDITELYKGYDYFVALSDNEGFCFSVVENLIRSIPCVVTDLPVFTELKVNETNSIKMNLDSSNVNSVAEQIFTKKFNFKYTAPESNWGNVLINKKSNYSYKEEENMLMHKVVATKKYKELGVADAVLGFIPPEGYPFEVDDKRLKLLSGDNDYKAVFVKLVEQDDEKNDANVIEIKEEHTEEKQVGNENKKEKKQSKKSRGK